MSKTAQAAQDDTPLSALHLLSQSLIVAKKQLTAPQTKAKDLQLHTSRFADRMMTQFFPSFENTLKECIIKHLTQLTLHVHEASGKLLPIAKGGRNGKGWWEDRTDSIPMLEWMAASLLDKDVVNTALLEKHMQGLKTVPRSLCLSH